MSWLYDTYIRFMVWLGAEPPLGYEYLLGPKSSPPLKRVPVKSKPAARPPRPVSRPAPLTPQQKSRADSLYRLLTTRVMGDEATANRLIEYERKCKPTANLLVWIQDANDRWEHDNRW